MTAAPATSATGANRNVAALPILPNDANINPRLLSRLQAVVERIATLDGQRGDPLDAALTKRDLADVGLLKVGRNGSVDGLNDSAFSGGWTNIPYLDAMPTPDAPTFKTGIGVNFLFWKLPNARGVGATQIFRRTSDTDGMIIAAPVGAMYTDLPVDYGVTYYYKIRFVSEKGVVGDWSSEAVVKSEVDPAFVVKTLQGQISESELATALRDKVKTGGTFDTAITNEATTRKSATDALASQINTVSANVGQVSAAVTAETTARIDADGKVVAKFQSTATAGGKTAGFAFGSDGKVSEFYIMADRFAVLSDDGTQQTIPFFVYGDKVYIDSAVIKDASITGAKIAEATITSANIASLDVMDIAVGNRINSSNYNQTTKTGWALNQDGSAEFYGDTATFGGKLEVRRVGSGAGVDITNDGIRVYDNNGVLRVTIGSLV